MIGIFSDTINAGLNLLDGVTSGDEICREDVVKLMDAGLTIGAISLVLGVGVDVVEGLLEESK